jgi:hypothetical protein
VKLVPKLAKPIPSNEETRNIVLIRGLMERGGFYWCYVAVKPNLVAKLQQEIVSNKYNIQNFVRDGYGEIIVSGRGRTPPQYIIDQLTEKLGVSFENLENLSPEVRLEKILSLTQAPKNQ